jgi:hypothetical protein
MITNHRNGVPAPRHRTPPNPDRRVRLQSVEGVETVEAPVDKPGFNWQVDAGLNNNFDALGKLLVSLQIDIYRHPDVGLLIVEDGRPRQLAVARDIAPFLIDHVRIRVTKFGKYYAEKPSDSALSSLLRSQSFLHHFPRVEAVVTTPVALADGSPSQTGLNAGGILYLGPPVTVRRELSHIKQFLALMEWTTTADRTNAVAALLTVPFRFHFPGGKPLILVTSTKAHSGKGTLINFIAGKTRRAELLYEDKDWPMQRALHDQIRSAPDIAIINLDNVRTDSSGRARTIRSGFMESFLTNEEIVLSTTAGNSIRTQNRFIVALNTNEGSLSGDLLHRSLPIRLSPKGDLQERMRKGRERLGGDIKLDWLPAHQDAIAAELWGLIEQWREKGRPLDTSARHPMGPWARLIGGILAVNGFTDFLKNYGAVMAAADPVREALSILAFHSGREWHRPRDLARIAIHQGLARILLPNCEMGNDAASERMMGVTLSGFVGEAFSARTATDVIEFRLFRKQARFSGQHPHFRYKFAEIAREAANGDFFNGPVLE